MKALFFGAAGVGKTTAAIQFPRPYLIDTERGAENEDYARILTDRGGVLFQTSDFDEMIAEVKALIAEQHEYRTLIIDPITVVYADLLDKAEAKVGSEFGRHYGEANKSMRHLLNLVLRLDMNVLITAHAKAVYGDGMTRLGNTFDGFKKLDYLFDLVFEVQKRGEDRRVGLVRKTRIENFADGEAFDWSYDAIAERYGRDVLERDAKPETLATAEQVAEIERLVGILHTDEATLQRWLKAAEAASFDEMHTDKIAKCIDKLQKQIEKPAAVTA